MVGSIANAVDGLVYLLVDKDYKNALYSLGSSVSFGAGKLVAWAGKGSKTALRIQRVCNFAGSAINFAQSAEGTVNMGGMMIDKYIIQGQPFSGTTAMEFLFLGANIFGATKSGAAIATDVRDFGKFAKMAGIPSLKGDNRGVVNAKALIDAFKTSYGKSSGNLNWDAIVSKKGETRVDHINRHALPNNARETHGVFNGNPIDMVNDAWGQRHLVEPISDGMGGTIYNIPYKNAGYESGYVNTGAQMDYITIVTMEGNADLITAFPSFGDYHK